MYVRFINEYKHEMKPLYYPPVGTIGAVILRDGKALYVQWSGRRTLAPGKWWCDTDDVEILSKASCKSEKVLASKKSIVYCKECRYYGGGETCRCNHPQLCFDVECYDQWLEMQPDDFCSRGEKCK